MARRLRSISDIQANPDVHPHGNHWLVAEANCRLSAAQESPLIMHRAHGPVLFRLVLLQGLSLLTTLALYRMG